MITSGKVSNVESKHFVPIMGLFQTSLKSRQLEKIPILKNSSNNAEFNEPLHESVNYPILKNRILLQDKMRKFAEGRIAVYGDSNCLDSSHIEKACYWLLITFLDFAMNSHKSMLLDNLNRITEFHDVKNKSFPMRIPSSNLKNFSKVMKNNEKSKCEKIEWLSKTYAEIKLIEPLIDSNEGRKISNHIKPFKTLHVYYRKCETNNSSFEC